MTTHFCPRICGKCPGCKQSFADLEAEHEAPFYQYDNDWEGATTENLLPVPHIVKREDHNGDSHRIQQ